MERFARNELLDDLPFEFDAMKRGSSGQSQNLQSVRRQGRTPKTND
jgi:hypothetical protein